MLIPCDTEYVALHRLFICPGQYLHTQYWEVGEVSSWREDYQNFTVLQPEIDRQLRKWLGWRWPVEGVELTHWQRLWIRWMGKLPLLLTALGLIHLRCPDYLLLGEYRRHLIELLGERALNQIFALWKGGNEQSEVMPEELSAHALIAGVQLFSQLVTGDWVGQMILPTLPLMESHLTPDPIGHFSHEKIGSEFIRLGRFL